VLAACALVQAAFASATALLAASMSTPAGACLTAQRGRAIGHRGHHCGDGCRQVRPFRGRRLDHRLL
jgi:hypothetical protein